MKCDELKFNLPNNLNNTSNQNKAYVWFTSTFFFEEKNIIGADDKSVIHANTCVMCFKQILCCIIRVHIYDMQLSYLACCGLFYELCGFMNSIFFPLLNLSHVCFL